MNQTNIFSDLLGHIDDKVLGSKVEDRCRHLIINEANYTRGGKNPYQGSYESQEASVNFNITKSQSSDSTTMDKADVALSAYVTQYSYLIQFLVTVLVTKEKYKYHKDQMLNNTVFILQAVLKD